MHRITYSTAKGKDFAYCSCRFATSQGTRDEVERQVSVHLDNVAIASTALATKTPSLKQQLDYFTERSKDPEVSEEHRRLWKQLADELRHRLGLDTSEPDSPPLW